MRPANGGSPSPFDVTPTDLASAAWKFASAQNHVDAIASTLQSALINAAGMAGNDDYGQAFARHYNPVARALFQALSATVRAVGQASAALMTTANNYIKADHHSNVHASSASPATFDMPVLAQDIVYGDPPSAVGPGHTSIPGFLARYWPNGHQDKLRMAAQAFRDASEALDYLGQGLHRQVQSLTDSNSSASIDAMGTFWGIIWRNNPDARAPMSAAGTACGRLAAACDSYANAIDSAHSQFERCAAAGGLALGFTSALAVVLTPFTGGGARDPLSVGGGGGGGGGTPPTGGGDVPGPGEPEPWGSDDADVTADRIVNHAPDRNIPGVSEDDLPEYLQNIMERPGYRLRPTPGGTPRMAWWDSDTGTVVIREGNGGTFLQPTGGYGYFLKLISE